jgi:hypothetical protein
MGRKRTYYTFVVLSTLLLSAGKAYPEASFPTFFVPVLPAILRPEPLPPASPGPVIPGDTAIMTGGISDVGSTREAGNTVQVTAVTQSAGGGMSMLSSPVLLPPYARPPTDTDLALASPFGGPGYASAGHPRTGGAAGRRYLPARARTPGTLMDLPAPASTIGPLDASRTTAGPLSPPAASPSDKGIGEAGTSLPAEAVGAP